MCRPVVSHAAQRYPPSRRFRIHAENAAEKPAGYPPTFFFLAFYGVYYPVRRTGVRLFEVIRRVGGLEYLEGQLLCPHHVIPRVGGLEDQAGGYTPLKAPFLTVGAFSRLPLT